MMKFMNKNVQSNGNDPNPNEIGTSRFDEILLDVEDLEFEKHKANECQTIFNIIKLFLGISILASPHAYAEAGLLGGAIGVAIAAILNVVTVAMQAEA